MTVLSYTHNSGDQFGELKGPELSYSATEMRRLTPKPHQRAAIADNTKALKTAGSDVRAQCIMACGTGKTLVGNVTAENISDRNLLVEPTLALVRQNLQSWRTNSRYEDLDALVVCSDQTIVQINADEPAFRFSDLPGRVTSSAQDVAAFLRDQTKPKLLVTTLHSTPIVAEAMRLRGVKPFGCAVIDEAHRTATREESNFSLILEQKAIPSRTRLFMTATPRIYVGDDSHDQVYSMDDVSLYGKRSHSLSFRSAINQGLLTDYRLVVAALTEKELTLLKGSQSKHRDAIAQLAMARAIGNYGLSKVMSFHSSVARAMEFADTFSLTWNHTESKRALWHHQVNGRMATASRDALVTNFIEQPSRTISILSNCRCLGEGVDIPALDCVAFIDKKSSQIDVVQAVGRVMRLSPTKTIGTIFIPLLINDKADVEDVPRSAEFGKVIQVIRALRAIDDGFEERISLMSREGHPNGGAGRRSNTQQIKLDFDSLPKAVKERLSTKIISLGHGLRGEILTEAAIIEAAREFYRIHGRLPSTRTKEAVPGMPNETWSGIESIVRQGLRGWKKGQTLSDIFAPLRKEFRIRMDLDEQRITEAARKYHGIYERLPTKASKEAVPDMPNETWKKISAAGQNGQRGLKQGRTLSIILAPLRMEFGYTAGGHKKNLSVKGILKAAEEFHRLYGKLPSHNTTEAVPGLSTETWSLINAALTRGTRGLKGGKTLSIILAPLRKQLGLTSFIDKKELIEREIIKAARVFHSLHERIPFLGTKEAVPGMPNETWSGINAAGRYGLRGLQKGRTLSVILAPLRKELEDKRRK